MNVQYTKLAAAQIQDSKNLVISKCSNGGYTIAQQISTEDNGKKINVYLKGAFQISTVEGLRNLRDSLNVAIEKIEKNGD